MITICVDVDGTLIWSEGQGDEPDSPRYGVINLIKLLEEMSPVKIYIWSGGGVPYAQRWADKLGLTWEVIEKASITPDIAIDDCAECTLGKVNIKV